MTSHGPRTTKLQSWDLNFVSLPVRGWGASSGRGALMVILISVAHLYSLMS